MKQYILLTTAAILIASCVSDRSEVALDQKQQENTLDNIVTLTEAQIKNAGIATGRLEQRMVSSVLKLNGKIDVPPQNMVSVSVPMGGYLRSTRLLPGMHIRKGEVIASVEDQQYIQMQQDYLTAKAQYSFNESEYKRQKDLNESKATSDKVFEQSRAAYQTQAAILRALEQRLRLIGKNPASITAANISRSINIYSPINGFVSAVNVNIGKYVNPSDVLFELVNPTDIHLALTVFEKDLDNLFIGQKLFAYTNSQPDKRFPCSIILISKDLNDDRSTEVHCHFDQYHKTLLPGMFMNADVELKSEQANVLPDEAVVRYENKQYVFIAKGNRRFEMKEVETGSSENGFTHVDIDTGLTNQLFVKKGAYDLLMAMKNTPEDE